MTGAVMTQYTLFPDVHGMPHLHTIALLYFSQRMGRLIQADLIVKTDEKVEISLGNLSIHVVNKSFHRAFTSEEDLSHFKGPGRMNIHAKGPTGSAALTLTYRFIPDLESW